MNGSTVDSLDTGLTTILSLLTTDDNTANVIVEDNSVFLNQSDSSISLTYNATSSSGTVALPTDFSVSPSGTITVYAYDDDTRTVTFNGTIPVSGESYTITYFRDHTNQISGNWVNTTLQDEIRPLPTNLKVSENTFYNSKFSYWWNTYNDDLNGVEIIDGVLEPSDEGLVWGLPQKNIMFKCPYDGEEHLSCLNFYNLSGSKYDFFSINKDVNPDVLQECKILDYNSQLSRNSSNYYVRYGQNNSKFVPLDKFAGSFNATNQLKGNFVTFESKDFGSLDFFEKNSNFDDTDLFGFGTKSVFLNVSNINGEYTLSDKNLHHRYFSLHENILFQENFESGIKSQNRFSFVGNSLISECVGSLDNSENCLMLYGNSSVATPTISLNTSNMIEFDFFDSMTTNTSTFLHTVVSAGTPSTDIKIGIDTTNHYFVETTTNVTVRTYLTNITRKKQWIKLRVEFNFQNNLMTVFFNGFKKVIPGIIHPIIIIPSPPGPPTIITPNLSLGKINSITFNHSTTNPNNEFSYFNNLKISHYEPTSIIFSKNKYGYVEIPVNDWIGAYLGEGSVLSNRLFKGDKRPNFIFELVVKGLEKKFIFLIYKLVEALKPAHTLADISITTDYELNTTQQIPEFSGSSTNWETGKNYTNIVINDDIEASDGLDLPGAIKIKI